MLPRIHEHRAADQMRRLGEFGVACLILAITFPLLLVVALAIRFETPGPILERRERIGAGGRRFQMLRFRTTVHDPKDALRPWAQKTTAVGQFLRQTRIDTLPQLLNVLRGEMGLTDTLLFD
ncbi:MAG: sugar transferase [Alphaproteobacteria bacterium]|nr:sugar transferase [Alphaproteobacteria bacterium]